VDDESAGLVVERELSEVLGMRRGGDGPGPDPHHAARHVIVLPDGVANLPALVQADGGGVLDEGRRAQLDDLHVSTR
jgi:hypothetical protein